MAPRYLLKSPTGHYFQHAPTQDSCHWTEDRAAAHSWVDIKQAVAAADRWHQLHGVPLTVVQR